MKPIFILAFFIYSNALLAQGDLGLMMRQNIYVYNDQKDTIHLSEINVGKFCICDTLRIIDTIQIDGIGSKEIVFF